MGEGTGKVQHIFSSGVPRVAEAVVIGDMVAVRLRSVAVLAAQLWPPRPASAKSLPMAASFGVAAWAVNRPGQDVGESEEAAPASRP